MPQINYDKSAAAANTVVKIGTATRINNFSETSKIKLISDILSEDISNFIALVNNSTDNTYSNTATGRYLDAKGADYGVYRKSLNSISVRSSDNIVFIETKDQERPFGDFVAYPVTIPAGKKIDVGTSFRIKILEDILVSPSEYRVPISVDIEAIEQGDSFQINKNDTFKLPTSVQELGPAVRDIHLKFDKPISIEVENEEDKDFRIRVISARDNATQAVDSAILDLLSGVPGLKGYAMYKNERGSSTIDIGVTTEELELLGVDSSINSILDMIRLRLRNTASAGEDIEVFKPSSVLLQLTFSYSSEDVSESVVVDIIYEAVKSLYQYSVINSISLDDIEEYAKEKLDVLDDISIESASLFDTIINEYINYPSGVITVPKDSFMMVNKTDIIRE
jgi:hypothetical protein